MSSGDKILYAVAGAAALYGLYKLLSWQESKMLQQSNTPDAGNCWVHGQWTCDGSPPPDPHLTQIQYNATRAEAAANAARVSGTRSLPRNSTELSEGLRNRVLPRS